jgi:hypothetical protein
MNYPRLPGSGSEFRQDSNLQPLRLNGCSLTLVQVLLTTRSLKPPGDINLVVRPGAPKTAVRLEGTGNVASQGTETMLSCASQEDQTRWTGQTGAAS